MQLLLCFVPVLSYSGSGYAEAQDSVQQDQTYRVNTITVYGQPMASDADTTVAEELWVGGKVATNVHDTPALVSVITEKEINQRNATTTEEILQYSPGLVTGYYETDDRNDYIQMRGYNATTYRDGMTVGSMRGVREDPYAYERVEVIRGGNSTLFGPADPGGSINFVSKRPKFEQFGNTYVSYGSFDNKEIGLDFGDTLNTDDTVAYRFTAKVKDSDLEYDYSKDNSQLIMGGLSWQPSVDTTATLIVDYLKRDSTPNSGGYPKDREYDRSSFYGEPDFNQHDVERTNITAQLSHYFTNRLKLSGNLRYSDVKDEYRYVYISDTRTGSGTEVDRGYMASDSSAKELIANTILQYDVSFKHLDSSTLAGLEYRDATSDNLSAYAGATSIDVANPVYSGAPTSLSTYADYEQDYTIESAFVQQNLSLNDRYILTVGARYDYIDLTKDDYQLGQSSSGDFSEISLRAAFTYKVNQEWSTYISQSESVAPPSPGDNVNIEPERGDQIELGVKYSPSSINALFSAAIYDLEKNNVSITVVNPNGTFSQYAGETRVKGLDLEMKAELTDDLSLTGGYSYMDTEVVRSDDIPEGNEFANIPHHSASLWGYYTLPNQTMDFGLGARYVGSYYFDAANTSKSEAATLFDAAFAYRISKSASLSVNVHNLTDKQYVVGSGTADYYNAGRSFNASLNYTW
ncbi:MAG: TonB-dependent siderophore receptor [Vibrio sp.]|uniref:TonB-dependent siderophore receptor n=1 Tax=Vibrio sp. TaxID=678 RepID=UPI003A8C30BF